MVNLSLCSQVPFAAFRSPKVLRVRQLRKLCGECEGSSIVGFVLVAPLVVTLFVAVSQIVVLVADKAVISSAATVGARAASASDASLAMGVVEAKQVLASRGAVARAAHVSVRREQVSGVTYVRMNVNSEVKIPWLDRMIQISSSSRALDERSL